MNSRLQILSWNCNSILAHEEEFKHHIYNLERKPDIICLQVTFLKPANSLDIRGYDVIRSDRIGWNGGGVATLIRQGLSYTEIDAGCKTTHEQITVQISMSKRKVYVSNIYCSPDSLINERTLLDLFERQNAILVGDFNAHHAVFGSSVTNTRGRKLSELMDQCNFASLNTGACTYTSHTGNESPIDLALASRNISTAVIFQFLT